MKYIVFFIKGIIVGAAVLIPGLSGGTAAIALGIYEDMLESTAEFFKNPKRNAAFLSIILISNITGVLLFSKPMHYFSAAFPFLSKTFFCFIALLSLFVFLHKSISDGISFSDFPIVLAGMVPAALISFILKGQAVNLSTELLLVPVGVLLATALVLPAISFSYMMLYFGIYDDCLSAINTFDISFLALLGAGVVIGILLCAKVFLWFLRRAPRPTYLVIAGFVFYSVFDIII